jgi:hypothetical protein
MSTTWCLGSGCKSQADNIFFLLQVLYDKQWVENVWSYTMPELVDPTIGDEW